MTLHTEPGDDAILAAGALDYVSFSYYRSNVCSTETRMNVIGGDPNPYLELTPWGWPIDPLGLRFADQDELIAQLLETRLLIEPNVAALAAVRRQEKQLAAMKTLLDKMDNAYLHGEDYTPYDFEFHSMIAQCTGNDVMMRLLPTIHESIQAGYHHTRRVEGSYQRASQCHLEMYRGILEHDSERARRAAQRHMMQTMHDSGVEVPSVLVK